MIICYQAHLLREPGFTPSHWGGGCTQTSADPSDRESETSLGHRVSRSTPWIGDGQLIPPEKLGILIMGIINAYGLGLMSLSRPYYMEIMGVYIDPGTHDGISHDKISWKEICVGYDWIFGFLDWAFGYQVKKMWWVQGSFGLILFDTAKNLVSVKMQNFRFFYIPFANHRSSL